MTRRKKPQPREIWYIKCDRRSRLDAGHWFWSDDAYYVCGSADKDADGWVLEWLTQCGHREPISGPIRFSRFEKMAEFVGDHFDAVVVKRSPSCLPRDP